MNKFFSVIFFFLFIITTHIFANESIKISNGEWPPFFSKDLKYNGVTSHIVSDAFAVEGIDVNYEWFPWKRSLNLARVGTVDAVVGWSKTKEREDDFLFSDTILKGEVVFFYRKDYVFDWNSYKDLKGIKIGTIVGYNYDNKIKKIKEIKGSSVFNVINEVKLFKMLLKGRFDVVIINVDVGYGILNKYYSKTETESITYHTKVLHTEYLRVLFPNIDTKSRQLLKEFDRGLKHLKQNGTFEQYYKNSRRGEYEIKK